MEKTITQIRDLQSEILSVTGIIEAASRLGAPLSADGRADCPLCGRTNSQTLVFDEQSRLAYCVSPECRYFGNAVDLLASSHQSHFIETLQTLAAERGLRPFGYDNPDEVLLVGQVRECLRVATGFYARHLEIAMPYLQKRGISCETAEQYLIGCTAGKDDLKRALFDEGFDESTIRSAGLLNQNGEDFFRDKLVVPTVIDGQVVSLYGRALSDDDAYRHIRMSNDRLIIGDGPFNWDPNRENIVIVEGVFDAISLIDKGFVNAVATFGTQGFTSPARMDLLKRSQVRRVFMCFDGDQWATRSALKQAQMLEDAGIEVRLVNIGTEDPNEFMLSHGPDKFRERLDKAVSPVRYQIEQVNDELEPEQKLDELRPVLQRCKDMQPLDRDMAVNMLAKKLGQGKRVISQHIDALPDPPAPQHIMDRSDHTPVHPALSYANGRTLIMVPQIENSGSNGKSRWMPYAVTSDREIFPLDPHELHERGYYTDSDIIPARPRYSPEVVNEFLDRPRQGDLPMVFGEVDRILRQYLDLDEHSTYLYLAAWIVGTYFFPLFNYYPYLHLTGTKNVGKSKTMMLMSCLCFNAVASASMSSAALFRAVEAWRSTVLMDETEFLHSREYSDKRLIINGGFQKGSTVTRTEKEGDKYRVRQFENFCPKAFASIEGLDDTLASRTVQIFMHRSYSDEIKEREVRLDDPVFQDIRDELFLAAMTAGNSIASLYEHLTKPAELIFGDREFNLFKPILTIGRATGSNDIVQSLMSFANAAYTQKIAQHNESAEENVLLQFLLERVVSDGWHVSNDLHSGLLHYVKTNGLELPNAMTKSRMGQLIRRLKILSSTQRSSDRKATLYYIKREDVELVATNYQVM
jgi:DNA primase catalytic core